MPTVTTGAASESLKAFAESIVCEYPCAPDEFSCEQIRALFDVLYLAGFETDARDLNGMHLYDDGECADQHPGRPTAGRTLREALDALAAVVEAEGWPSHLLTCSEADTFALMLRENGHRETGLSLLDDHPDVNDCRHYDVPVMGAYLDALTPESAAALNVL